MRVAQARRCAVRSGVATVEPPASWIDYSRLDHCTIAAQLGESTSELSRAILAPIGLR